eukprot:365876-Chlamydomonas_euryale.AAC.3
MIYSQCIFNARPDASAAFPSKPVLIATMWLDCGPIVSKLSGYLNPKTSTLVMQLALVTSVSPDGRDPPHGCVMRRFS